MAQGFAVAQYVGSGGGGGTVTPQNIQDNDFIYADDVGSADTYVCSLNPALTSYQGGQMVIMLCANNNTGASTLNVNGIGATGIISGIDQNPLVAGQMLANSVYIFIYNDFIGAWELTNPSGSSGGGSVNPADIQNQAFNYALDSGAADAYEITVSPAPASYENGQMFSFTAQNANTGATQLDVNGLGFLNVVTMDGYSLPAQTIFAGGQYDVIHYNGTFYLLNPTVTAYTLFTSKYMYGIDSGAADAYVVTVPYSYGLGASYEDGMTVMFSPLNNNTGASTIDVNDLGPVDLVFNGMAIMPNQLVLNCVYIAVYFSGSFNVLNPSGITVTAIQNNQFNYGIDVGAPDAYVVGLTPAPLGYTGGLSVTMRAGNSHTVSGTATLNVNGLGDTPIYVNTTSGPSTTIPADAIVASGTYTFVYDDSFGGFFLMNPTV